MMNSQVLYGLLQIFICAIAAWVIWKKRPFTLSELIRTQWDGVQKTSILEIIQIGLIGVVLLTLFVVGFSTPPNNLDSLHTHLTRIYYWLQHGSLDNWVTTVDGSAQLIYPINAHLQGLWLFLLGGSENLFFLVSWFSLIVICSVVYEISRLLKFSPTQSLVSVMVLLTFPVFLLQTYSFQNDLPVTALIMCFIWLTFSYLTYRAPIELVIALLALALSLGIKQTAFLALPAIFGLLVVMLFKKKIQKKHIPLLGFFLAFFLVLSSFKYIQNIVHFNSIFGVDDVVSEQKLDIKSLSAKISINAPRFLYDAIDPSGVGYRQASLITSFKVKVFRNVTSRIGINLEEIKFLPPGFDDSERFSYMYDRPLIEDAAWFGPLLVLIIPFSFLIVLIQKNSERKRYLLFTIILNLSYFALVLIQRPGWDPFQGRYFILVIAPLVPLAGVIIPNSKVPKYISLAAFGLLFIYLTTNVTFLNGSKPIVTSSTVINFQNSYIKIIDEETEVQIVLKKYLMEKTNLMIDDFVRRHSVFRYLKEDEYYNLLFFSNNSTIAHLNVINLYLNATEPLYLMINREPIEYGLFGINRSRSLFPVNSLVDVEPGAKVLVETHSAAEICGFRLLNYDDKYALYQKIED
jgi:4-amino-4-deoxy-L-arabinose transferase-like glycosyltransferase